MLPSTQLILNVPPLGLASLLGHPLLWKLVCRLRFFFLLYDIIPDEGFSYSLYPFYSPGNTFETGGYFIPPWTLRDDVRMNSFRACREMLDHLATPAEQEAISGLNNNQLTRQCYINTGSGVVLQAELLQRFCQLNRDYRELTEAHMECGGLSEKLKGVEEERDAGVVKFEKLLKEFHALEDEVSAASTRQEGLVEQLEEMERNRNEWQSTASSQAAKIRELEGKLSNQSAEVSQLQGQNKQLTASLAQLVFWQKIG